MMIIRRQSSPPWSPSELASLAGWWDASDSATLFDATTGGSTPTNGNDVRRWEDKSGAGLHMTSVSAAESPHYATSSLNNKAGLDFDGADDYLQRTSVALDGFVSMFAVAAYALGNDCFRIEHGDDAGSDCTFVAGKAGDAFRMRRGANYIVADGTADWAGTAACVMNWNIDGSYASSSYYKNGTAQGKGTDWSSGTVTDGSATKTLFFCSPRSSSTLGDGVLYEVIICNEPLATSDREKVEGYLAHKWGLSADLPEGHPYEGAAP